MVNQYEQNFFFNIFIAKENHLNSFKYSCNYYVKLCTISSSPYAINAQKYGSKPYMKNISEFSF
jgi:hypothetical protein